MIITVFKLQLIKCQFNVIIHRCWSQNNLKVNVIDKIALLSWDNPVDYACGYSVSRNAIIQILVSADTKQGIGIEELENHI